MAGAGQRARATTDQLRRDIDEGRTGEKVAEPDPAAAPLGCDDEAAGRPADAETLAELRAFERAKAPRRRPAVADPGRDRPTRLPLVPIGVVAALLLGFAVLFVATGLI